jgi:hypothetical protein
VKDTDNETSPGTIASIVGAPGVPVSAIAGPHPTMMRTPAKRAESSALPTLAISGLEVEPDNPYTPNISH